MVIGVVDTFIIDVRLKLEQSALFMAHCFLKNKNDFNMGFLN